MRAGISQSLYYRLPTLGRSAAATMQGMYLRWWRYGPGSARLVREAIERDAWTLAQWETWRQERLLRVLHRAATRVPYYRAYWHARRRRGDRASWERLENWPLLDKQTVRENARAFVADDRSVRRMFHLRTSGTTGTPLDIWRSPQAVKALYSWGLARTRGWHGLALSDRRAMIGGQLVAPVAQRRPPFWVWNAAMHQLYMSSYHLAPSLIPHYLDALARYRIQYLAGYSSSLYALAVEAIRLGRDDLRMQVALSSSEPLFDYQREAIAKAFHCPVRETYGLVELVAAASECPEGKLHLWPEVGVLEVLQDERAIPDVDTGELICTGLVNIDMPLIRYRTGDRGALAAEPHACPCGRTLPVLASVEGRLDDLLYTPDGRQVGRLSQVVKALPVREAQIVQDALDRVRVRYVPSVGFDAAARRTLIARVQERMGAVDVELEPVTELPRTANGKIRTTVCNLPVAERLAQRTAIASSSSAS